LDYLDETLLRRLTRIRAITDDNQLNDAEKVEGIRTLLNTHETSVSDDGVNLAALKRDLASELSEDDYYRSWKRDRFGSRTASARLSRR